MLLYLTSKYENRSSSLWLFVSGFFNIMSSREDFPYTDEWYAARGMNRPESKLYKYLPRQPEQNKSSEWDSQKLIGDVHKRFEELKEKGYDWRSFYNAWLEGRADMLAEIKGFKK